MVQFSTALVLVLIASISVLSQDIADLYVRPDNSSLSSCPYASKPCLTLQQYAAQQTKYFISGAMFNFMAGSHSINIPIFLNNTSNVSLKAVDDNSDVIVLTKTSSFFQFVEGSNLIIHGITLMLHPTTIYSTPVISIIHSKSVLFVNSAFIGQSTQVQALLYSYHSDVLIKKCKFQGSTGRYGGAVHAQKSNFTFYGNVFKGNVGHKGGAVFAAGSNLTFSGNIFLKNEAKFSGGAICITNHSNLLLIDGLGNTFAHNSAKGGGAVFCSDSTFAIESGTATSFTLPEVITGGASRVQTGIFFINNSVHSNGGAIHIQHSTFTSKTKHLHFTKNHARQAGGGMFALRSTCSVLSASFTKNTVLKVGGAIGALEVNASFCDISATENIHALFFAVSRASFSGDVNISQNRGVDWGGMRAISSSINFTGHTVFEGNRGFDHGGAIRLTALTTLSLSGTVLFKSNYAHNNGGAMLTSASSTIVLSDSISFIANRAGRDGGAIYFENSAKLVLKHPLKLILSSNHADRYGGAIFHSDAASPSQCSQSKEHPLCFVGLFEQYSDALSYNISATNNVAEEGSLIFGGFLDRCRIVPHYFASLLSTLKKIVHISVQNSTTQAQPISSEPYELCFCESYQQYECDAKKKVVITHRGTKFSLPLLALAQGNTVTSSPVRAKMNSTARLLPDQRSQHLPRNCTSLEFNLFSTQEQEQLILYLDNGPCFDVGYSRAVINVTFLPCPNGFILSGDQCICEERLQIYRVSCVIPDDGEFYFIKKPQSTLWMRAFDINGTYEGMILCLTCPTQYCKTGSINITLHDPDIQCAHNRSGILCGACAANYSLTLGSSTCELCSNTYLALLLAFAGAGIVLVVFLTFLRLTVATGMINSVILYTNMVQANRDLLPTSSSLLSIFVAWMNLDLGFKTCFYDGMDAYVQTWLQFAFPVYVWILMSLIILASRYSMTVTKLIGSNPIAVLATLLLMSYTKLLKIIIEVYSSVDLEYPDNKTVTVWLKDANEPYLQSRHLALTVVTTCLLVFLFLPYTLLLLLGYKLYRFTGRKHTRWLIRIKPLLDAYYAPYKNHTRYWTGLLLLVRCALYVVFSYNSLGHKTSSLVATNVAFGVIIVWLSVRIYSKLPVNTIEAAVYLNLIALSTSALAQADSPVLVDFLVGIVFVLTMGIIIYHLHIFHIAKSALWLKLRAKITKVTEVTPLLAPAATTAPGSRESTRSDLSIHDLRQLDSQMY